jgi:hypothetical protein
VVVAGSYEIYKNLLAKNIFKIKNRVMKKFAASFLFVLVIFFVSVVKGQVLNGNITLSTQADVDAFNWTQVNGTITITGSGITNLNGLSELTKCQNLVIASNPALTSIIGLANLGEVEHNLTIRHNSILTNITGFSSLTTVGNLNVDALTIDDNDNLLNVDGLFSLTFATKFVISGNAKLANLNGLSALTEVEHFFMIINNPLLTSISGLSNLTKISSTGGNLTIDNNDALASLNGLSGLTYTAGLIIQNNAALTNLDALSNLSTIQFGGLKIENNPSLTSISGLSNVTFDWGDLIINNNALLTNLDGLNSIQGLQAIDAAHNFEITNNASLNDLSALSTFAGIADGDFIIQGNNSLTNLNGLSKLFLVGKAMRIKSNPVLANIDALTKLHTIHDLEITGNTVLANLNGLTALDIVVGSIVIRFNPALVDFCGLYHLFHEGEIGGSVTITNNGANTVSITPLPNRTVNADQGQCSAVVSELLFGSATVNSCLPEITGGHSDFPAGDVFPVGTTNIVWTATDGAGNTATAVQSITVVDNQPPVIVAWPSDVTVSCANDVPAADDSRITATDNCPGTTISHRDDVITNQTCVNRYTVTRTYVATDHAGNTATRSQVITVNDNVPPQITSLSVSQQILAPPNHKMVDVTVNYQVSDNCVSAPNYTIAVTSNEPVNATGDGDTDPDWVIVDDHHIKLRAERAANGSGRIYTITITANDGCNSAVSSSVQVRVTHNITSPQSGKPFIVGSTVNFSGEFWDKPTNKHTAKWLIDDNTSVKGTVTEPTQTKNGKITGSYKFNSAGVYKLQMNTIDQNNVTTYANTNGDLEEIVVIYDPNGGYAYGGGWFESQAGALLSDPGATGKASYGFTVNYFKSSTYPKGETQFEFKIGSLEFNALNFDYLVINNAKAQFRGTGKITGDQSGYGFIMTVIDGDLDGTGVDKIRMKIYNKTTGRVIYDNQPGASDATDPVTAVGDNSSVVIYTTNNLTTKAAKETEGTPLQLQVHAVPNPSSGDFAIMINTNDLINQVSLQVTDLYGRVIEKRTATPNSIIRIGDAYNEGVYIITIRQDKNQKQIKLVKTSGKVY